VTGTCPICKHRAFPYKTRRLHFSSDSQSEQDERRNRELVQTVEIPKQELSVARDMCHELKGALELTEVNRTEVETLHQQALDDYVEEKKENLLLKGVNASLEDDIKAMKEKFVKQGKDRTAEFSTSLEKINKIHTNIAKGLHKENSIKEKQILNANDKIKDLLLQRLDWKRSWINSEKRKSVLKLNQQISKRGLIQTLKIIKRQSWKRLWNNDSETSNTKCSR
jgi:hypothetical protein